MLSISSAFATSINDPKIISFTNGNLTLGGELFLPRGAGPFPVILYNHGSAPNMKNSFASAAIGPEFTKNGWAFFMPYRRGQGLSEDQGAYIIDEIQTAAKMGLVKASEKLLDLMQTEQLSDQMAALAWLQQQDFVDSDRIATVGNSFGGIQVLLGVEQGAYCAGVNAAGAAQSWAVAARLQERMKRAAGNANSPILFFQAANDYDLSPSITLASHMKKSAKPAKLIIYPPFGTSAKDGHSLPWAGVSIWFSDTLSFLNQHCAKPDL